MSGSAAVRDRRLYLPLPLAEAAVTNRGQEDYNVIAKLKPGVSAAEAQVEMDAITRRLRADYPDVYPPIGSLTFSIVPLLDQVVGGLRQTLLVLFGSVGIAVGVAVGASGRRLAFQLLVESLSLVLRQGMSLVMSGAALGLLLALALSRVIGGLLFGVAVADPLTFLGSAALLGAMAPVATLVPARRAARTDPVESLRME